MMRPIGDIISKHLSTKSTVLTGARAANFVELANDWLYKEFGPDVRTFASAKYFKTGALSITCLNSVVAQEIRLREASLLQFLAQKSGSSMVKKILYRQIPESAYEDLPNGD